MIKNYFKIALRNLRRQLGFSVTNIAGLTLGLSACLLIGLFVRDEKQYDQFIPDKQQVYRIYDERAHAGAIEKVTATPPMFATTLKNDYPEVDVTARILMAQLKALFEFQDKQSYEENGLITESSFFDIFPLHTKYGSINGALNEPSGIILSQNLSERLFGKINPIGKTLQLNKKPFQVKAVLADDDSKFHLKVNFAVPLSWVGLDRERMENWHWQQFFTYVKLKRGANEQQLENKFQEFIKQKIQPTLREGGFTYLPFFQPLSKIHLYSADFKFDIAVRGNIVYVKGLTAIAVFILLIACFNFVNLATAKSMQRAKEVGVRKSIGASRIQLVLQFIGETIMLTLISMIISIIVAWIVLPYLNQFTGKEINLQSLFNPLWLLVLIAGGILLGALAGFYPALVLSGFNPISVLKNSTGSNSIGRGNWLRQALVVIQFSISALLIISTIVVFRQVNYLHKKDLGFNKEQIMFFPMQGDKMFHEYETFKNELQQSAGVSSVSIGYGFPGDIFAGDDIMVPRQGKNETHSATQLMVDYDYVKTLGLTLVAGRDFSKNNSTDKDNAFIINETAVKELGFQTPEKAIGQRLLWHPWETRQPDSMKDGMVIGVVKDFNYKSLYDKMETTVLQIYPPANWKVAVKLKTADLQSVISHVKKVWGQFSPEYPIDFKFMDENFDAMYKSEEKLLTLVWIFTGIAIFVGCLGLFGLAAYAAQRRMKEIGIRKVLGATVNGLVMLLSKEFLMLVLVALFIASPIAWYFMNSWLQDFAYRISIGWQVFALAGAIALFIALLTISFQAVKAAIANPIRALRTE